MKKRLLLVLIFIISICLVGCGKEETIKDNEVVLENIKYTLDQEESEYGIKYKVASNFRKTTMVNAVNYFSENINDSPYFVIRIYHYKDKSIDYAIKDSTESYDNKWAERINNTDYTAVHFVNYNGAETNLYYHKHKNDVYVFVFTSSLDLTKLKDIFINSIVYE